MAFMRVFAILYRFKLIVSERGMSHARIGAARKKSIYIYSEEKFLGVGQASSESPSCLLPDRAVAMPKILHSSIFGTFTCYKHIYILLCMIIRAIL